MGVQKPCKRLFYKPKDAWVGDLIPYSEGGKYYCFYLHDPRRIADEFAEDTTWHLAVTEDFVHITDLGEAIKRGTDDEPDKNAYTGSVIRGKDGKVHAFFTAYNDAIKVNGKSVQSVMQAAGDDPCRLVTDKSFRFVADGVIYEEFDWRDPFVFYNEDEKKYWMLLCARRKGAGKLRGGCVGLAKSDDLYHWTYEKPFYDTCMYIAPECPEVFKWGKKWYLLFSEFSDRFATRYRMAESLAGPWTIPEDDVIDTRADYAIKTVQDINDSSKRYALGWVPTKRGETDFGEWEWGGEFIAHELHQDSNDGRLLASAVPAVLKWYNQSIPKGGITVCNACVKQKDDGAITLETDTLGAVLRQISGDAFRIEADIEVHCGNEIGLALHCDEGLNEGYFLRINLAMRTAAWDMWPRRKAGKYQWQAAGDVPYQVETMRLLRSADRLHITVIREGTLCTVYINNETALTSRMYNRKGGMAGVYAMPGRVTVKDFAVYAREQ